jgi:hypothetical protein
METTNTIIDEQKNKIIILELDNQKLKDELTFIQTRMDIFFID